MHLSFSWQRARFRRWEYSRHGFESGNSLHPVGPPPKSGIIHTSNTTFFGEDYVGKYGYIGNGGVFA
tara:strand:- start:120 stop:320 length:201 start_codon:yes stop_codon:yes gene_type:complete